MPFGVQALACVFGWEPKPAA